MVYVFFAYGFEEIEGLTVVDVLRRADIDVKMVGVGGKTITGAHGITVHCDVSDREVSAEKITAMVMPGGMPGAKNLEQSRIVQKVIDFCIEKGLVVAAICAAPMILGNKGLLESKKATIYPGMEEYLKGAEHVNEPVVQDGNILTGNGPGSSLEFALRLTAMLKDVQTANEIGASMQCPLII